jgi:hypothetical protein
LQRIVEKNVLEHCNLHANQGDPLIQPEPFSTSKDF